MQTDAEVAAIAAKMNYRVRTAISQLSDAWQAGPDLSEVVIDYLKYLRSEGLVEREFGDDQPAECRIGRTIVQVHMVACWHFRLTPLGLRVAQHLKQENTK